MEVMVINVNDANLANAVAATIIGILIAGLVWISTDNTFLAGSVLFLVSVGLAPLIDAIGRLSA